MFVLEHICIYSFRRCYTGLGVYPNYMHIKVFMKRSFKCFFNEAKAQIGTNVRAHVFNGGMLARSQFVSGRSYERQTLSRFSVVFLGPRSNTELVPKSNISLHTSHAAFQMVTLKFRLNVPLPISY
jgi:hypothetical protein